MNAKHTPGPWRNSSGTILAKAGKVAEAGNPGYDGFAAETEGEAIANARLIASAPDLLATLREFLRVVDALGERNVLDGWPVVSEALAPCRAAMRAATGGSGEASPAAGASASATGGGA